MTQHYCDMCSKPVTSDDGHIFLDFGEYESVIICSKSCGYKWIDVQFDMG